MYYVALLAWLPEYLIFGKPYILDVCIISGASVAAARDKHYHNPPGYIVREPEDTTARTRNLQQTNTNGYKFQGTPEEFAKAQQLVERWGEGGKDYKPNSEYQILLRDLIANYQYRLDTNFAKIDRIVHPGIEVFKSRVLNTEVNGLTVKAWAKLLGSNDDVEVQRALEEYLDVKEDDSEKLVE